MDSIYYYEFDLNMSKLSLKIDTLFDFIDVDLNKDILINESAKGTVIKIKDILNKYTKIYLLFLNNVKEIFKLYKSKRSIERNLKLMKRTIKKDPELANQEINFRLFSHYKKTYNDDENDVKYHELFIKNLTYRIQTTNQSDINNIIDDFYKSIDHKSNITKININVAINETEKYIETIDNEINRQKEYIKHLPDYINDFESSKSSGVICKIFKVLKRKCMIIYSNIVLDIELLYRGFNEIINKKTKDISKEYVKKRVLKVKRPTNIYKNSKKIETIDLFGIKIDIYETDRYIESVFTNGSAIYLDKSFKELPRMYQLSTLYHELGHILYGHSGNNMYLYRDEYKLSKNFKKKIKKIITTMEKSQYNSDDELIIYLLAETEADSFSVEKLGKRITRKALNEDYKQMVKMLNMTGNNADFNLLIGKTRGKLL